MAIRPFSQEVEPGKRFYTEVELNAQTEHVFDSVRVCISYPRLTVRPVKVFDYPIQDLLDPASPPQADTVTGSLDLQRPTGRGNERAGDETAFADRVGSVGRSGKRGTGFEQAGYARGGAVGAFA